MENAAKNLFRVSGQPGVQVIRQIFTALPKKSQQYTNAETSYTGLFLLVQIQYEFHIQSEKYLEVFIQEGRKEFLKRRSMTHTILQGIGFEVNLVKGKEILDVHYRGGKVKEGITVFPVKTGVKSQKLTSFLRLDRVPSRYIQDFTAPDLPVFHRIGSSIENPSKSVGFPEVLTGTILICGSNNKEVISLLQTLTHSFTNTNTNSVFIIDPHNEFNGLVKHYNDSNSILTDKEFQLFQLGSNMFVNICDVIIPPTSTGKKRKREAIAAWKSYLISQILLNSLKTSFYLTSRFALPLENQIHRVAEISPNFTVSPSFSLFILSEPTLYPSPNITDKFFLGSSRNAESSS